MKRVIDTEGALRRWARDSGVSDQKAALLVQLLLPALDAWKPPPSVPAERRGRDSLLKLRDSIGAVLAGSNREVCLGAMAGAKMGSSPEASPIDVSARSGVWDAWMRDMREEMTLECWWGGGSDSIEELLRDLGRATDRAICVLEARPGRPADRRLYAVARMCMGALAWSELGNMVGISTSGPFARLVELCAHALGIPPLEKRDIRRTLSLAVDVGNLNAEIFTGPKIDPPLGP